MLPLHNVPDKHFGGFRVRPLNLQTEPLPTLVIRTATCTFFIIGLLDRQGNDLCARRMRVPLLDPLTHCEYFSERLFTVLTLAIHARYLQGLPLYVV